MSSSFTASEATTFTITHARHIAAKVATDLKRIQRFYNQPSDSAIADYETELTLLLKGGYLESVAYGFRKNGAWVEPTVSYVARDLAGIAAADDDPGRIRPGADIAGASFYSYLTYSPAWSQLTQSQMDTFQESCPVRRTGADQPSVNGYYESDKTYSAGSRALDRSTVRSF